MFDGKDGPTDSNILLSGKTFKIRRNGFCVWCWLGRCELDVQIMPFIDRDLLSSKTVVLNVFALTNHDAKVSRVQTKGQLYFSFFKIKLHNKIFNNLVSIQYEQAFK